MQNIHKDPGRRHRLSIPAKEKAAAPPGEKRAIRRHATQMGARLRAAPSVRYCNDSFYC